MDGDASIEILEPDVDQQYVPETTTAATTTRKRPSEKKDTASSLLLQQKPPVLIVERQVLQPTAAAAPPAPVPAAAAAAPTAAPTALPAPTTVVAAGTMPANAAGAAPAERAAPASVERNPIASRIVNIVAEPERVAAQESENWWQQRVNDLVSLTTRFFAMAIVTFFTLVLLNPPFVQQCSSDSAGGALQKRPASLSRAAVWGGIAGAAFLLVPPLWGVFSSRFFPDDLLLATGLRKPK